MIQGSGRFAPLIETDARPPESHRLLVASDGHEIERMENTDMKIARFEWQGAPRWGVVQGDMLHAMEGELFGDMRAGEPVCAFADAKLLAPMDKGTKALGLGLVYKDMWAEYRKANGIAGRDGPATFMKPPNSVIAHNESIVYHDVCKNVIYEAEVGVVIGKRASRLSIENDNVAEYVAGYTCVNDMTCNEFKTVEQPIVSTRFKILDTFCPIGPVIETEANFDDLVVICRVNGREVQHSRCGRDMSFTLNELLVWVTAFMTLEPGDIIASGADGMGRVEVGDVIEVDVSGIGILSNPVVAP